jgi:hypothetical protein
MHLNHRSVNLCAAAEPDVAQLANELREQTEIRAGVEK